MSEKKENNIEIEKGDSTKDKKSPKLIPLKKLPSLLKKAYTEKAFEKKILNKLYIEEDKKLLKSIFSEKETKGKKELIFIKKDLELPKEQFNKLKDIAKQINNNKGRIKLIPLLAVAGFITALVIVVMTFKNPIAKKIVKSGCESIFGAKTDIKSVNVELLGISVKINGLAIGDKKSENYMKNLIEAENITLDMNFTQALRGKVIVNDISITGMQFGTARKTSCYIPIKKKSEKAQEESAFMKSLKAKSNQAIDDLKKQATDMLGGGSVDEIVSNIQSQLQTPDAAKKAQEDVQNLITKWQSKPNELKGQVDNFATNVKDLQSININDIKSGNAIEKTTKIKEYIDKINSALNESKKLKSSFESVQKDIKSDVNKTNNIKNDIENAVKHDKDFISNRIGTIVNNVKNPKNLLTNAMNTIGYDLLGKYYPYVQQGIVYANQMQAASKTKSETTKKEKKETVKRLKGTTFWYSKENPKLWIKNVSASGYTQSNSKNKGFSGAIKNITSDQNLIKLPTTAEAKFDVGSVNHSGKLTVDVRESSKNLIAIDYTGVGFNAKIDGNKIASASGIPSIDGKAKISLYGAVGSNTFTANGNVSLNPLTLTSDGFSNELMTKYYKQALASVKNMDIGYKVKYDSSSGVDLGLSGNFADQFAKALETVIESVKEDAKNAAIEKINEQINKSSNEVTEKIKSFLGIEGEIDIQNTNLDTLQKSLEAKKSELENQLNSKVDDAKSKVEEKQKEVEAKAQAQVQAKTKAAENKAKSKASSTLKGLLKK